MNHRKEAMHRPKETTIEVANRSLEAQISRVTKEKGWIA
jgi:hypothetical protein